MQKIDYFLGIAQAISKRSKDPSSKVGAIIVDKEDRIVSTGYNGFIGGCNESYMTMDRPMKYHLTIHAEMNAMLYAHKNIRNHIVYCTDAPCENCLKHMAQSGISKIYYEKDDIIKLRGSQEQLEAIYRILLSTNIEVMDRNGNLYEKTILTSLQERFDNQRVV